MSGRKSRDKGARREREPLHLSQEHGFAVTKHSGMYKAGHDLSWPLLDREWRVEVKARAKGFREIYRWLQDRDALLVRADRERWLLVVPLLSPSKHKETLAERFARSKSQEIAAAVNTIGVDLVWDKMAAPFVC
jgi:hypothetical protein